MARCAIPVNTFLDSVWSFLPRARDSSLLDVNDISPSTSANDIPPRSSPALHGDAPNASVANGTSSGSSPSSHANNANGSLSLEESIRQLLPQRFGMYQMENISPATAEALDGDAGQDTILDSTYYFVRPATELREDLKSALNEIRGSEDKLSSIFPSTPFKLENPSKEIVSFFLSCIFASISNVLGLSHDSGIISPIDNTPLSHPANPTSGFIVVDYRFLHNQKSICVVKIKPPYIFPDNTRDPSNAPLDSIAFQNDLRELHRAMIAESSRFGIITDGHFLVLVEFRDTLGYYQYNYATTLPDGTFQIGYDRYDRFSMPFDITIVTVDSTDLSFIEALLAFLFRSREARKNDGERSEIFNYTHIASQPRSLPPMSETSSINGLLLETYEPSDVDRQTPSSINELLWETYEPLDVDRQTPSI